MPATPVQPGLRLLGAGITHDAPSSCRMQMPVRPATFVGGALDSEFGAGSLVSRILRIGTASHTDPQPFVGCSTPITEGGGACSLAALLPAVGPPVSFSKTNA